MKYDIFHGTTRLQENFINSGRWVNMYVFQDPSSGEVMGAPTMGLGNPIIFPSGSTIRGSYVFKNNRFFVCSQYVYTVDDAGITTEIGELDTASGYVKFTSNDYQVGIVDGSKIYIYNTNTSVFSEATGDDGVNPVFLPPNPSDIASIDGYAVVVSGGFNSDSIQWYVSKISDMNIWLDPFGQAREGLFHTKDGDFLRSVRILNGRIYLFGDFTMQIWYDSSNPGNFPFSKYGSIIYELGVKAPASLVEGFQRLVFLGSDKDGTSSVYVIQGDGIPRPISSKSIDLQIQDLTETQNAQGIIFRNNSDIFYQISFGVAEGDVQKTFLYNFSSKIWVDVEESGGLRHRAANHVYFNNKHYIGAYNEGVVYEFDDTFYSNNGTRMPRIIVGQNIKAPNLLNRVSVENTQLEVLPGQGEIFGDNFQPEVRLSWSKDGGFTFGNAIPASIGKIGQYNQRCMWRNKGVGRHLVPKFEFYNDVPFYVVGCYMDIKEDQS